MIKRIWLVIVCTLAVGLASAARAQNQNAGDIRGTVTDASGAVVPGATVTVTNNDTGVVTKYVTNGDGIYDTNSILPGTYTIDFSKTGFQSYKRSGISLTVETIAVNAALKVGSATETISVSSDAPILKTEDAQVSTTLGLKQLSQLPSYDPEGGYFYLLKLLPGASSVPSNGVNGGGQGTQEPAFDQAISGTMPYFSSYLIDGGSIWLPHSANTDQGLSEAVQEVNVTAVDAPAQYGGGGSVFNIITKTGSNQWHGSVFDYFQNDALNARDFFDTVASGPKGKIRYNYFGGSVGGPVIKNKIFFFFDYQQLQNPQSTLSTGNTVPTAAMKAGCFDPTLFGTNLQLDAAHGGTPLTTNPAQCSSFNAADLAVPTGDFDPIALNLQSYYVDPDLAGIQNNLQFLSPAVNKQAKYFGHFDYYFTQKNHVDFSIVERYSPSEISYGSFPDCPLACNDNSSDAANSQISDVWSVSSNVVNEVRFAWNRQADYDAIDALGQGIIGKIGLAYSTADAFPNVSFSGTGSPSNINPGTEALFIQNTFDASDMATWIKGKHILHFGGEVLMEEDNSTPWGSINGASLSFTGQFTAPPATNSFTPTYVPYADFLLGDVQSWNTQTYPKHYMRAKDPAFFVQDDIKLRPNLTVNLGVRAEIHGAATEKYKNAGGFDPNGTDPIASTPSYPVNSLGTIWFEGTGGRDAAYETKYIILPRLGAAWTLSPNWVVRGGVGQYDSLWSEDTVGGVFGFGSGSVGSANTSSVTDPVVQLDYADNGFAQFSSAGVPLPILTGAAARNPLSYITPANPQGSGGTIPFTPYSLPIQNGWQWSIGVQHRLPANMVAEVQYIGSHWSNMMYESDQNQLPADKLGCPSNPTNPQVCRPYPQFSGIGTGSGGSNTGTYNGWSNYSGINVELHVPTSHGVSAEVYYTWSRLYDTMDDSGWGNQFGNVYYQDAYSPASNYARSNLNRTNAVKGTVLYAIPFGKGHQFMTSSLGDELLGGWQASGDWVLQSGAPISIVMNNGLGTGDLGAVDGNSAAAQFPNRVGDPQPAHQSINEWFNQEAFAAPALNTFGTYQRNSMNGPDLLDFDTALSKSWGVPRWEQGKFMVRVDAVNIFNHPSFGNPNTSLNPAALGGTPDPSVGQITGDTITGRQVMLTGRFEF